MNRRLAVLWICAGALLVATALLISPTYAQDEGQNYDPAALEGSVVFATYCAACHGAQGEAIGEGPAFASIQDYDPNTVKNLLTSGQYRESDTEAVHPAYGEVFGGPLDEQHIDYVIAYMATWNSPESLTPPLPEPNISVGEADAGTVGDPQLGATIYAYFCYGCHGENAEGRGLENFPAFSVGEENEENILRSVAGGEGHGGLPGFSTEVGGPLSPRDLEDLSAYLRTLQKEEEEEGPEGVSILVIIIGLGAIALVGAAYMANRQFSLGGKSGK